MAKKEKELTPAAAMKAIQVDAFLAYIEWPLLLFHRLRELERHLAVTAGSSAAGQPANAPAALPSQVAAPIEAAPNNQEKKQPIASRLRKTPAASSQPSDTPEPPAIPKPTRKASPGNKATAGSSLAVTPKDSQIVRDSSHTKPASPQESNTEAAVLEFLNGFSMEGGEP
jgi:hypothetical protein